MSRFESSHRTQAAIHPPIRKNAYPERILRAVPITKPIVGGGGFGFNAGGERRYADHDARNRQRRTHPSARAVVPAWHGDRADRGRATGAVRSGQRRGRIRGPDRAAWADGAGRLPPVPPRSERCRRRLPGDVPRPGAPGGHAPPPGPAGQLALWGRPPGRDAVASRGGPAVRPAPRMVKTWSNAATPASAVRMATRRPRLDLEPGPWLHEEVRRLPEKYRTLVLLCYFEGLTHEQTAARGWAARSARSRAGSPAPATCSAGGSSAAASRSRPRRSPATWPVRGSCAAVPESLRYATLQAARAIATDGRRVDRRRPERRLSPSPPSPMESSEP